MFPGDPFVARVAEVWRRWHLNTMRAGREHQREASRATSVKWPIGSVCATCGYAYGSAWLVEEVPPEVLGEIRGWIEMANFLERNK